MKFGSEETFKLVEKAFLSDNKDIYEQISKILYEDVRVLVNKYCNDLPKEDKEDIVQNVVCKAYSQIVRMFHRFNDLFSNSTEKERNAYIKRMVLNARNDFYRKNSIEYSQDWIYIDDLEDTIPDPVNGIKQLENREVFFSVLKHLLSGNTSPDKLLAFIYSKLIYGISSKKESTKKELSKKGFPKEVIEVFEGKLLRDMYEKMKEDLQAILKCEIPMGVLKPLHDKVYGKYYNECFHLSEKKISGSSYELIQKGKELKKYYE